MKYQEGQHVETAGPADASQLSSRVSGLFVSMCYCLCGILHALPVAMWVFPHFLPTRWTGDFKLCV